MWDCAIIGGGPAGLIAATYLGRFKRDAVLIDAGQSRLKRIPKSRNVPGFPDGISGAELHARMQDQASRYGTLFRAGEVQAIKRGAEGFSLRLEHQTIEARTVLLASGAKLIEPELAELDRALAAGLIRYCPICDGYEAQDKDIAVLGGRPGAIAEAHFLRIYSDRVTYFWQDDGKPTPAELAAARGHGIRVTEEPVAALKIGEQVEITSAGARKTFDVLYPCLGCDPQSSLTRGLGADHAAEGGVRVGAHMETSIAGLFAAGDVLQGLDQIASACGQAAIAAVAIHNRLNEPRAKASRALQTNLG